MKYIDPKDFPRDLKSQEEMEAIGVELGEKYISLLEKDLEGLHPEEKIYITITVHQKFLDLFIQQNPYEEE